MKLYDNEHAPNPRRVRMVLAEKGLEVERVALDIGAGDNLSDEFKARNPMAKVPVLELDDGLCLSETGAICRYLDETYPEPALFGTTAKERAIIDMWDRRMELGLMFSAAMGFQHIVGFFKDRMTPVPAWGEQCVENYRKQLPVLETQLSHHEFVAGSEFTIADITAVCAIDFMRVLKVRLDDSTPNLQRWYQAMRERPSYRA